MEASIKSAKSLKETGKAWYGEDLKRSDKRRAVRPTAVTRLPRIRDQMDTLALSLRGLAPGRPTAS